MFKTTCALTNPPFLRVKRAYPDAVLPLRAHATDSGLDVTAYRFNFMYNDKNEKVELAMTDRSVTLKPQERVLVDTGICATVGVGMEIQVRSRSGLSLKQGLVVTNQPGTVDESFRAPIGVILINTSGVPQTINVGDRIAQLVVAPVILSIVEEVDDLDSTDRGLGGFGSTGV